NFLPILCTDGNYWHVTYFISLSQSNDFKEFIKCSEAAWEKYVGLSRIGEADLSAVEIVEINVLCKILVHYLGFRKSDGETNRFSSRLKCTPVASFHNAGASSRDNRVAKFLDDSACKSSCFNVVRIVFGEI